MSDLNKYLDSKPLDVSELSVSEEKRDFYFEVVNDYMSKLSEFNLRLKGTGVECVFNNQLIAEDVLHNKIKCIVVMDNPGQEEREQGAYLVGTAGKAFNKVLKSVGLERKNVLVFNKSAITTPATNDLNSVYRDDLTREIFLEEQELTFEVVRKIALKLNIPIMLHGYASYFKNGRAYVENEKSNRPLYVFFRNLRKDVELRELVGFYKHSSYGNLSKQISAYCVELGVDSLNFEQYLELGKKNIEGFYE